MLSATVIWRVVADRDGSRLAKGRTVVSQLPLTWALGVLGASILWFVTALVLKPRREYRFLLYWTVVYVRVLGFFCAGCGLLVVAVYSVSALVQLD